MLAGLPRLDSEPSWFEKQDELMSFLKVASDDLMWLPDERLWSSPIGRLLAAVGRTPARLRGAWFREAEPQSVPEPLAGPVAGPVASPAPVTIEVAPSAVELAVEEPPVERAPDAVDLPAPEPVLEYGALNGARANDPCILQLSVAPNLASLEVFVDGEKLSGGAADVERLFSRGGAVLRLRAADVSSGHKIVVKYTGEQ